MNGGGTRKIHHEDHEVHEVLFCVVFVFFVRFVVKNLAILYVDTLQMDWTRIHEKRTFGVETLPLAFLSVLYAVGVKARQKATRSQKTLPGFVVSIGNITVGGTGKTPAVIALAEWARDQGYRVAVLSRGYGGRHGRKLLEVSDGHDIKATPKEAGDEPYMMAERLDGVPVVVSKERYQAGLFARRMYGSSFFILDDGFQHLRLKRDMDLVLLDASRPYGNGHLLPWGPLREPIGHLARADCLVLTRVSEGRDRSPGIAASLTKRFPGRPILESTHRPDRVVFPQEGRSFGPEFLKGKRLAGFAGIARPEAFRKTLISIGAEVVSFKDFPDHYPYTRKDVNGLDARKRESGAQILITTEKDWVRLRNLAVPDLDLAYLRIAFSMLPGEQDLFQMVRERMEHWAR